MADEDRNQLYDPAPDSFSDRWGSLPVETPEYNLTPNVALVRSQPRQIDAPYKFVPVEGDPFEKAAERTKAPYKHVNELTDDKFPYRSNLPLIADKFMNTAISGATAARDAYTGALQVSDPLTGMPTEDAIKRSIDVAALGGPGGLVESQPGVVVGSGMMRPKPEVLDRVLPAVKNTETGKIATVKRGEDHADILHRIWTKQGGDPNVSTQTLYDMVVEGGGGPKHETGFYDPKTKEFHSRTSPEWQNVDSPDLMPKRAMAADRVFSDTSKPGQALAAMTDAPAFYSAVEHAVNNTHQNKMPAEQWLGTLNNAKGVKPEEMDWTGLKDFLAEKGKTPVTKAEVQEHLNANKVELKEVGKQDKPQIPTHLNAVDWFRPVIKNIENEVDVQAARNHNPNFRETFKSNTDKEVLNQINEYKKIPYVEADPTKYSQYQLPGGEPGSYREMLLTLPDIRAAGPKTFDQWAKVNNVKDGPEARSAYSNWNANNRNITGGNNYTSSHWDEPNVLAHIRMNDRNIEGKKSLHIEEIQSDLHQSGRDKGYRSKNWQQEFDKIDKQLADARSDLSKEAIRTSTELLGMSWQKWHNENLYGRNDALQKLNEYRTKDEKYLAAEQKVAQLEKARSEANPSDKVPDFPFKKSWHELALKRMIREAAEKGYPRISWTPGEAQAARYDLSKQIENITLHREKNEKGGTIQAYDKNGKQVIMKNVNDAEKELPDIIGKEATEKLLKQESKEVRGSYRKVQELKNADLKVGGEGMKGFYDKMLPNAIEKIGKEHGVKVKQAETNTMNIKKEYKINRQNEDQNKPFAVYGDGQYLGRFTSKERAEQYIEGRRAGEKDQEKDPNSKVHYIDIPQSLRDVAMKKGFPLFSSGYPGIMLTPIEGDPFERKK